MLMLMFSDVLDLTSSSGHGVKKNLGISHWYFWFIILIFNHKGVNDIASAPPLLLRNLFGHITYRNWSLKGPAGKI